MNRYQREALAEIQAKSDARLLRLAAGLRDVLSDLPVGKRPRLSSRLMVSHRFPEAIRNARRLYEALREIDITEPSAANDEEIARLEDEATAALTALVEDMK